MAGRLALGVATAFCLLTAGELYAQGTPPAGPGTYGPPAYAAPPAGGQAFAPPQATMGDYAPPSSGGGACPNPYVDCNGMISKRENGDADNFVETPCEELICRALRNVNVRVDYLNWGISRPHTTLIGETPAPGLLQPFFDSSFFPTPVQTNPTDTFPVNGGIGRAYDTTGISLSSNSGLQLTFSLPMTYGTIEVATFALDRAISTNNPGGLPQGTPGDQSFAVIPVSVGGQPSTEAALFSQSFSQTFSSFVWGTETNIIFNPLVPKDYGFLIKPLVGFRFMGLDEHFDVSASNPGAPPTTIESSTINNIYGPQVGCRFELMTQWFTVGLEPKIAFAVNQFASTVNASDANIGTSRDHLIDARFAPVGALNAYVKVPIQEHIRLYVAYNLLGIANVSRPQSQVDYDVTTNLQNNTHLNLSSAGVMIQGYSVGAEINF